MRRHAKATVAALTLLVALGAPSAGADPTCPNESRRVELHSTALPDCRAWEMVSPPDKGGNDVMATISRTRAAADGSAVGFASAGGFGDIQGSTLDFEYMSVRRPAAGANGWATHATTPPNLTPLDAVQQVFGLNPRYMADFSLDSDQGIFLSSTPLTLGAPNVAAVPNIYLRTDLRTPGAGTYHLLSDCPACTEPLSALPSDQPAFAAASDDFSHIIFESTQNLTDEALGLEHTVVKLYEWIDGDLSLAGVLPGEECPGGLPCPAYASEAGQGALYSSSVTAGSGRYTSTTMSRDGSRIVFTVPSSPGLESGQIYLRTDNDTPTASTLRITASENSSPDPCESTPATCPEAKFWAASSGIDAQGQPVPLKVFFTTKQNLVDEDTSGTNTSDLYMYDEGAPVGQRLTFLSRSETAESADVQGVVSVSANGNYAYFISNVSLVAGQAGFGNRVYVWHDGSIRPVAKLTSLDVVELLPLTRWAGHRLAARITADGSRLAFVARGTDESPHDGAGDACLDGANPAEGGCRQVYLYDTAANGGLGRLTCVSCHEPPSAPSETDADFNTVTGASRNLPQRSTSHLSHALSDDGRYVFFTTGDALLPADTNGVSDVYEYDTQAEAAHLLSSGTDPAPSYFMDASADGSGVFFVTRERLSGWDTDQNYDLYDARTGGGFPEPQPVPASCRDAGCRQGYPGPPLAPVAASATFAGPPNRGARRRHHKKRHHKKPRSTRANHGARK